jgi:hypothetical protein
MTRTLLERLKDFFENAQPRLPYAASLLDDVYAELAKPEQPMPAWHDEPNCAGIWIADDGGYSATTLNRSEIENWEPTDGCRWYGPIPEDTP